MDNAEPSTNGDLLNDERYEKLGNQTVAAFEVEIGQHPGLFSGMMSSVVAAKIGVKGIMVVGDDEAAKAAVKKFNDNVTPNHTIARVGGGVNSEWLRSRNELLRDVDGSKPMVQLCEGGVCKLLDLKDVQGLF